MQKMMILNFTEIFNVVKEVLLKDLNETTLDPDNDIESINTKIFHKQVEDEKIDIQCIEIDFNKGLDEIRNKYSNKIKNLELKDGIDQYHSIGYIEMCDLSELVGTYYNEEVTEIYEIFESNLNGDFEEQIGFYLV